MRVSSIHTSASNPKREPLLGYLSNTQRVDRWRPLPNTTVVCSFKSERLKRLVSSSSSLLLRSSMDTDKDSQVSSDRQKWQKIFNALVHMLQTQQTQVGSLAKERKLLEDRIKFQYGRWLSDVHSLQDQIAQVLPNLLTISNSRVSLMAI